MTKLERLIEFERDNIPFCNGKSDREISAEIFLNLDDENSLREEYLKKYYHPLRQILTDSLLTMALIAGPMIYLSLSQNPNKFEGVVSGAIGVGGILYLTSLKYKLENMNEQREIISQKKNEELTGVTQIC